MPPNQGTAVAKFRTVRVRVGDAPEHCIDLAMLALCYELNQSIGPCSFYC